MIGDVRQGQSEGQCRLCGIWRTFYSASSVDWATRKSTLKVNPETDRHLMADER